MEKYHLKKKEKLIVVSAWTFASLIVLFGGILLWNSDNYSEVGIILVVFLPALIFGPIGIISTLKSHYVLHNHKITSKGIIKKAINFEDVKWVRIEKDQLIIKSSKSLFPIKVGNDLENYEELKEKIINRVQDNSKAKLIIH